MEYVIVTTLEAMQGFAAGGWRVHSWKMNVDGYVFLMEREIVP